MTTFKRINLLRPIKFFLNRIRYSKSVKAEPSGIAKNPWQEDLVRLAAERRLRESDPELQDEITHFVNNLAKNAQEGKTSEEKSFTGKYKRQGDKTVNDLKSWWKDSVGTFDENQSEKVNVTDAPGERRMMKRWFQ